MCSMRKKHKEGRKEKRTENKDINKQAKKSLHCTCINPILHRSKGKMRREHGTLRLVDR